MMRLSTKMAVMIAVMIVAGLTGAIGSFVFAWRSLTTVEDVTDRMQGLVALQAVRSTLMQQQRQLDMIVELEDPRLWIEEADKLRPQFRTEMSGPTDNSSDGFAWVAPVLAHIELIFQRHEVSEGRILALHERGETAEARRIFLAQMNSPYRLALRDVANPRVVQLREDVARDLRMLRGSTQAYFYFVSVGAVVILVVGGIGLYVLSSQVFGRLREIRKELHESTVEAGVPTPGEVPAEDNIDAISRYLRELLHQMHRAREQTPATTSGAQQSERLAALGDAMARLVHELRSRFVVIGLFMNRIRKKADDPDWVRDKTRQAQNEVLQVEKMLNEVRDFTKRLHLDLNVLPLSEVVRTATDSLAQQRPEGIELDVAFDAETPQVAADSSRMEQVILNLVRNAWEAMDKQGRVTVRTYELSESAVLEVADTGPGIPDDVLEKIFQPFFTTKETGTGLGLPITREIILAHGGDLDVRTEAGQGTTFIIKLPKAE